MEINVLYLAVLGMASIGLDNVTSGSAVNFSDYDACGPCSLYMACKAKGLDVNFDKLVVSFKLGRKGETSLYDLEQVATFFGLLPVAVRVESSFVEKLPMPFIAHIKSPGRDVGHFVLVMFASSQYVLYIDAPSIATLEAMEHFEKRWSGNALMFVDSEAEAESLKRTISWISWEPTLQVGLATTLILNLGLTILMALPSRKHSNA